MVTENRGGRMTELKHFIEKHNPLPGLASRIGEIVHSRQPHLSVVKERHLYLVPLDLKDNVVHLLKTSSRSAIMKGVSRHKDILIALGLGATVVALHALTIIQQQEKDEEFKSDLAKRQFGVSVPTIAELQEERLRGNLKAAGINNVLIRSAEETSAEIADPLGILERDGVSKRAKVIGSQMRGNTVEGITQNAYELDESGKSAVRVWSVRWVYNEALRRDIPIFMAVFDNKDGGCLVKYSNLDAAICN